MEFGTIKADKLENLLDTIYYQYDELVRLESQAARARKNQEILIKKIKESGLEEWYREVKILNYTE